MNSHLFQLKGDMIEAYNPACPPPSAIIGTLAKFDSEDPPCHFNLHFEASMNVAYHRQRIFSITSPTDSTLVLDEAWTTGRPPITSTSYGYPFDPNKPHLIDHQLTGGDYRFELIIENDCGITDTASLNFSLPDCETGGNTGPEIFELEVFPNPINPFSQPELTIRFNKKNNGPVRYYISALDVYGNYTSPQEITNFTSSSSNSKITRGISTDYLVKGMNYLQLVNSGKTYVHIIEVQ